MTDRNITILHATEELEYGVDKTIKFEVDHVERDDENNLTIYGIPKLGEMYYIVLDQWVIDQVDRLNRSRNHYVVCESGYMGMGPKMYRFTGTYRELLEMLHRRIPDQEVEVTAWMKKQSTKELETVLKDMNGDTDTMPYTDVWSMDGDVQVIGQR